MLLEGNFTNTVSLWWHFSGGRVCVPKERFSTTLDVLLGCDPQGTPVCFGWIERKFLFHWHYTVPRVAPRLVIEDSTLSFQVSFSSIGSLTFKIFLEDDVYMWVSAWIYVHPVNEGAHRDGKSMLDVLELVWQLFVCHHVDAGNWTWMSARAASTLNCYVIAPVLGFWFLCAFPAVLSSWPHYIFVLFWEPLSHLGCLISPRYSWIMPGSWQS